MRNVPYRVRIVFKASNFISKMMGLNQFKDKLMLFSETIYNFLFKPAKASKKFKSLPTFVNSHKSSFGFLIYISVLLGLSLWFFVFYPEIYYYKIPLNQIENEVITVGLYDSLWISLLLIILPTVIFILVWIFIVLSEIFVVIN